MIKQIRAVKSAGAEIRFDPSLFVESALVALTDAHVTQVHVTQAHLTDAHVFETVAQWFDPTNPALHAHTVTSGGRAAAWFIQIGIASCVLRYYRRGGLVARVLRDQYFWCGAARTRAFAEFSLMRTMVQSGLSVPEPLAVAVWRRGLIYRGALITQRVEGAKPLAHILDPDQWAQAGREIARMHLAGVWHADLNVFNILVDLEQKVWLIDFDRARMLSDMSDQKRSENLTRLKRSVRKVAPLLEPLCWPALVEAYTLTMIG